MILLSDEMKCPRCCGLMDQLERNNKFKCKVCHGVWIIYRTEDNPQFRENKQ